jgi:hypothetical protein
VFGLLPAPRSDGKILVSDIGCAAVAAAAAAARLCTLKGSLLKLQFLTHLDISFNSLKGLPKVLGTLSKLRFLQELNLQVLLLSRSLAGTLGSLCILCKTSFHVRTY